jgi:hypothetical protein
MASRVTVINLEGLATSFAFTSVSHWFRGTAKLLSRFQAERRCKEGRKDLSEEGEENAEGRKRNFKPPDLPHFRSAADSRSDIFIEALVPSD